MNGIDVIEKSGVWERSILVTDLQDTMVRGFEQKEEFIKVLYKGWLKSIPITLIQ
jgi:hypothetical protein